MAVLRNGTPATATPIESEATATTSGGVRVTVLLVEPDPEAAALLCNALFEEATEGLRIEWTAQLTDALECLSAVDIDVVLIAPDPPGNDDEGAFARIRAAAADALILPLGGAASGSTGVDPAALLATRRHDACWLADALRHVARRKAAEAVLRAADEALFEEKERARVTLSSIGDAVLVTDLAGAVSYLNPVAEIMTGWTCIEAMGRPLSDVFDIIDGVSRQPAADPAQRAMRADHTVELEANCVLCRRDGSEAGIEDSAAPVHDRHGQVTGAVIVFRDINQSRTMTRKMAYMAHHDMLTDLANRALLNERFTQARRLARRHGKQVALLFVDLDEFKRINDSLGHMVGDRVLRMVARRLIDCVRTTDTVCRQGGDEFIILLSEIEHPNDAARVVDKVRAAFAGTLMIDGRKLHVSMSIGISIYPDDGETMEAVMKHADHAMYKAKTGQRSAADSASGAVAP